MLVVYEFLDYYIFLDYGLVGRVFANGPSDLGSLPGGVIPKDFRNGTWYLLA